MTPRPAFAPHPLWLAVAFIAAWTLYGALSLGSGAIHHDMVEAYVWGREFRLGYYKHPPFWAWIAGAWFAALPRSNAAAALLSVLNAAVGLAGAGRLCGLFAEGAKRSAATILLAATPFYTLWALRFNANAIFLSLWPWTLVFFVRSLDRGRWRDAVGLGALVAAAGLSKYYAVVLAIGCALALPLHPRAGRWLRSGQPWIAALTAAVLIAPHLVWLAENRFPSFGYFRAETGQRPGFILANVARQPLEWLAAFAVVIAAAAIAARSGPRAWLSNLGLGWRDRRFRLMVGLLAFPLLLTLAAGLAFRLKLSSNWTEGAFPLGGLLALEIIGFDPRRTPSAALAAAGAVAALAIVFAAAIDIGWVRSAGPEQTQPRRELAEAATRIWRGQTRRPLAIVAGSFPYDQAIAFYSADRPSVFIDFDARHAPWITPGRLAQQGWLAVCTSDDGACLKAAGALATPRTRRLTLTLRHIEGRRAGAAVAFDLFLTPPAEVYSPVTSAGLGLSGLSQR
jgi:4-amino-4-deoxy-L-arabinose transferase-like glycosyltransferase